MADLILKKKRIIVNLLNNALKNTLIDLLNKMF